MTLIGTEPNFEHCNSLLRKRPLALCNQVNYSDCRIAATGNMRLSTRTPIVVNGGHSSHLLGESDHPESSRWKKYVCYWVFNSHKCDATVMSLSQTCDARLWWLFGDLRGEYMTIQCKMGNERHCYME